MWAIRRTLPFLLCLAICSLASAGEDEPVVPADDELVAQLTSDFQHLLSVEPNPQPLREAAELLANTDWRRRWTRCKEAMNLIRQARSKAGIPLILKYRILHGASGFENDQTYLDTLTILTGRDFGPPIPSKHLGSGQKPVPSEAGGEIARQSVADAVASWWDPQRETISTDMGAMTAEQLDRIAVRLLKCAASDLEHRSHDFKGDKANNVAVAIRRATGGLGGMSRQRTWWPAELHEALVPRLLAAAGYVADPPDGEPPAVHQVCYPAIPLLAECRKNGQAADLHLIATDDRQAPATRLTCALAVYAAGEKLNTDAVLAVLDQERRLTVRLAAVASLRYSTSRHLVTRRVLELLNAEEDVNREIIISGVEVLGEISTLDAVSELRKITEELYPPDAVDKALTMLGQAKCSQSAEALAGFLAASVEDPKKAQHLHLALTSFASVTGHKMVRVDWRTSPEELARLAGEALAWWHGEQRQEIVQPAAP